MITINKLGFYLAIFFLICSGVMFWQALSMDYYSEYGPGAGLLPLWVNGLLIVLTILYLVLSVKKEKVTISQVLPKGEGTINVLVSMVAPIIFLIIIPYVGFVIAGTITLFILFMRGYKWYWSLGLSTVVTILLFWVFDTLLQVPLPVNDLGW